LDYGSTGRGLAELNFGHDVAVIGDTTTAATGAIDDIWSGTALVGTLKPT
jgi:hypothetical protein